MLHKETKEKLEGFGFDVSKLEEAIKSDSEVQLEVPELKKQDDLEGWLSPEQKQEFGNNRFQEGKTAMSEIKAKELKEKFQIDVEGKDLDNVINSYVELREKKAANGNSEWLDEKKKLQSTIQAMQEDLSNKDREFNDKLFNIDVRNKIMSEMPKDAVLSAEDLTTLMLNKYTPKNDNGSTVFFKGDTKLKDNVENPLSIKDVVSQFITEGNYKKPDGMGGGDTGGGSSTQKFKNTEEFYKYCEKNGIEPNGSEGQKLLSENKAEDFKW